MGVTVREPDRAGAVGQDEVLALKVAVWAVACDNRVHAQHLPRHVGPATRDRERLVEEHHARSVAAVETVGGHDAHWGSHLDRHVFPPAFHALEAQVVNAFDVLTGSVQRRTN